MIALKIKSNTADLTIPNPATGPDLPEIETGAKEKREYN